MDSALVVRPNGRLPIVWISRPTAWNPTFRPARHSLAWTAEWVNKIGRRLTARGFGGGSTMEHRRNMKGRGYLGFVAVACIIAAMAASNPACAQHVGLIVNGDVITT